MNIIFIGTCGVYHPLIAANLYMNHLNTKDYNRLEYYADHDMEKSGKPVPLGTDSRDNRIYTLGVGPDIDMVKKTIEDLRTIFDVSADQLIVIPIKIKYQLLILVLYKIASIKQMKSFLLPLIGYLINSQLPEIKKQLDLSTASF